MRVLAYCRGGFEPEVAADLRRLAARIGANLELDPSAGQAYVAASCDHVPREAWQRALTEAPPIFARSVLVGEGPFAIADPAAPRPDRVTPLLQAVEASCTPPWRSAWVEFPDTNDGKALSTLARALAPRIESALQSSLRAEASRRLRILLTSGAQAYVGESDARMPDWPLGIPRLRMPPGAPSRSTQKLAEAFEVFLGERASALLRPGMHAVDLGAAPGGWTWQLVQRGLHVTAVDNGPLKGSIRDDRLVRHVREDAFRFVPRRPVDWLVCDVVEQPIRIADLVARWLGEGLARHAIFNLKLPMKKRYDEVRRCEQRIVAALQDLSPSLALRQLYHDREEVTGYLTVARR
ncbi:MAG: 23S rRNA (cytidine(2498)-2'-O)-methyltransferase RlmM [Burkholderiales bacterium]